MNERQLRQAVVDTEKGWLGARQGDAMHKEIIDLYNDHLPHPRGYKMTYTAAWCAATASAASIKNGLTSIMSVECSCSAMIELYKKHADSKWIEDDAYKPLPGDLVFYDWQDAGTGDNLGAPEHVGTVIACDGYSITVIEGNYSNSVKTRPLDVNGRYIRGFAVPAYWKLADNEPVVPIVTLKYGSLSEAHNIAILDGETWAALFASKER